MKILLTTTALLVGATGAMAQGFTGGSVSFEYSDFSDFDDSSHNTFSGSAEFEIIPQVSVAADFTIYDYEALTDTDLSNFTIHGIYEAAPGASIGIWLGRDMITEGGTDFEVDYVGVEGAYSMAMFDIDAYFGSGDDSGETLKLFGLSGGYNVGSGISIIGAYDLVDFDDIDVSFSTIEIGGEYDFGMGASIFATVGKFTFDAGGSSDDENIYSIGAKFGFGPEGDTTFGPHSYLATLPF